MITQSVSKQSDQRDYSPSHPCYYKSGGAPYMPKQILATVKSRGYKLYMEDDVIAQANNKYEPHRSAALRIVRENIINILFADLERYREVACELRKLRQTGEHDTRLVCSCVHTSMSLKYNHISNDFSRLLYIDELLYQQPDLFD